MKKYRILGMLVLLAGVMSLASCSDDDPFNLNDPLPESYLGAWIDVNDNELAVTAKSITFEEAMYNFTAKDIFKITFDGEEFYTVDGTNDGTVDFYMKQGSNANELQMSTFTLTQEYITYTKQ